MARTLGAPESVPAGNAERSTSPGVTSARGRAGDLAHDVHHVRVPLDDHVRRQLDRAGPRDAAHVVAREVDQHHVLGALLRIREQLGRERGVLRVRPPAAPRAGDRAQRHLAAGEAHEGLRRGAGDGDAGGAEALGVKSRKKRYGEGERTRSAR